MKRALVLTLLMAAVLLLASTDLFASSRKAAAKRTPPSAAFSRLDKNGDGFLSRAEFEKSRPSAKKAKAAPARRKTTFAHRKAAVKPARLAPRSTKPTARRLEKSSRRPMSTGAARAFGRPARSQVQPRSRAAAPRPRAGRAQRGMSNFVKRPRVQARPARGRGPLSPAGPAALRYRRQGGSGDIKKRGAPVRSRSMNRQSRQRPSAWQPWMGRRRPQMNPTGRRPAPSVERRAPARTPAPVRRPRQPQVPSRRPGRLGGQSTTETQPTPTIASDQDVIDNWQLLAELGLLDQRNL